MAASGKFLSLSKGSVREFFRRYDGLKVAIKQVPKQKVKRWGRVQGKMVPIEFELLDKVSDGHKGRNIKRSRSNKL